MRQIQFAYDPETGQWWSADYDARKVVVPVLDWEAIGKDADGNDTGDFTGPLKYSLEMMDGMHDFALLPRSTSRTHTVRSGG